MFQQIMLIVSGFSPATSAFGFSGAKQREFLSECPVTIGFG